MVRYIKAIIGLIKLFFIKLFHLKQLSIKGLVKIDPSTQIELMKSGKISLGRRCSIGKDAEVASVNANMTIEDNVHIGDYCMIIGRDSIKIGKNTIFGPHVYVYDHDHGIADNGMAIRDEYKTSPVIIGENVWIGTNTVILKGTIIGEGCIIGAGSVVSGTIPPFTKVVQKRINKVD